MSAICGVVHRAGEEIPPDAVAPMMRRMAVFGPDGGGTWHEGPAALGCQRLQVTPESRHERLPLTEGAVTLVADVRLDNRDELLPALGVVGSDDARTPDSALLLRAYLQWGEACIKHLTGDFAFALWDERRRMLYCARDHLGMRPLYYHVGGERLAFATTLRALLDVPDVPWELDELRLADYLTANWGVDPAATFFASIRRLPPAHTLTLHGGEVHVRRYWAPDLRREIRFRRDDEYVEAFRAHLERAVRDRLRTTHGVASFLSGGIDSPAVASLAARELARTGRPRLITYSNVLAAGDPWPAGDERALIEAVLGHVPHMEGYFIEAAGKSLAKSVQATRNGYGIPGPGSQFIDEALSHAQRSGVRVLLDGYGGDQAATSSGGGALDELLLTGRWPAFARLLRARARGTGISGFRIAGGAAFRVLQQHMPRLTSRLRPSSGLATLARRSGRVRRFVAPDLAARVALSQRIEEGAAFSTERFRRMRDRQWHMLSRWEPHRSVEDLHATIAARGVERVLPMLDRRLVEYALAVPCEQHSGVYSRALIRRATEGVLPDAVRLREDKSQAAIPAPQRYIAADPDVLRQTLDEVETEPSVGAFVDIGELRECLLAELPREVAGGQPPRADLNAVQRAFRTACFLMWVASERRATMPAPG